MFLDTVEDVEMDKRKMTYDSIEDTTKHIDNVRLFMDEITYELEEAAHYHASSKLQPIEKPLQRPHKASNGER